MTDRDKDNAGTDARESTAPDVTESTAPDAAEAEPVRVNPYKIIRDTEFHERPQAAWT